MIRFDSDYLEGCLPEILESFERTNFEQTVGYGEDHYCTEAKDLIRRACGTPDAEVFFLVGGTQTNMTVIDAILLSYQGVICASTGHINVHETGAVESYGHKILAIPTGNGKITAEQVEKIMQDHEDDASKVHMVQPALVYISFPTELGTIYSKSELSALSATCRKWDIPLFLDGARLGYGLTSPECDLNLQEIAALADVFYIGGTKQGALFGECVVFTRKELATDFKYYIKQKGGMLAKGRLLGLQYKTLFTDNLYFHAAQNGTDKAMKLKAAFKARGIKFLVDSPTNQQFPILSDEKITRLRKDFGFEDSARIDERHRAVRFCTSWATTDEAIDTLIKAL